MPEMRRRSRWRWLKPALKWLALVLIVLIGAGFGVRAYVMHKSDKDLQEVMDELDRTDPGWRWDEIQAAREVIPPEENSAPILLAANKLIPKTWPGKSAVYQPPPDGFDPEPLGETDLPSRIFKEEPNERLGDEVAEEARVELAALAEAIAKVRAVGDLPKGRYDLVLDKNPLATKLPHAQDLRKSAALLELDSAIRAHDGDIDGALESARCGLNAARSLGDEPLLICQLVRIACATIAVKSMERGLGQGLASDGQLQAFAKLLAADDADITPALRTALRGERALFFQLLEIMTNGELSLEQMADMYPSDRRPYTSLYRWAWEQPLISLNRQTLLEYMTRLVDLAELSRTQRQSALAQFDSELKSALKEGRAKNVVALRIIPAVQKVLEAHDRHQANLRNARVAIAVERYRLAHKDKQWPENLDQLVPAYLDKVPTDPFDDQPIRYRRVGKDVVIYSVGLDGVDDGGFCDQEHPTMPGTDMVFRLYHPDNRGVPAKPKPPPELPDMP
jgi:hypothetical protein